jgi:hypothetical protein
VQHFYPNNSGIQLPALFPHHIGFNQVALSQEHLISILQFKLKQELSVGQHARLFLVLDSKKNA